MALETPVAIPEIVDWELHDRKGETRTYEQRELSIEEEVRLLKLIGNTVQRLSENNFPWDDIPAAIAEDGTIDWAKGAQLLVLAVAEVPELVTESTLILFGIHPTLDNGQRNKDYENEKVFIKKSINFTKWISILEVFSNQNDYQRLVRPFSSAAAKAMESGMLLQAEQQARARLALSRASTSSSPQDTEAQDTSSDTTPTDS